ncbi:amino acid ABC transporter permease [Treponema zuelzerae]|uniref:Amino acid ABC transporter permease n=1 Tax=Teretinema zuelzerae TaxID=156 RepID=A0AAE3EIA8_9SPIR|nr:amino acid ABC transporter permease [Teretinema zuelzerae]MCD1655535.1 amino acid ABC transporter permease [Teretinema zuelzerae]
MDRPFEPQRIFTTIPVLLPYVSVTVGVAFATLAAGLLLGWLLAAAKLGKPGFLRFLANGYTWILRCTPSIVLLFIVFYGLPEALIRLFGINIHFFHTAFFVIVTLSLLFAATVSEIMRSSYLSVDRGQYEAAVSSGLSGLQANIRIVLPQAAVSALPNLGNALVSLMKEGALAYTIGLIDMMGQGILLIARNYGAWAVETYTALALLYWALIIVIEKTFGVIERRLSRGKRSIG